MISISICQALVARIPENTINGIQFRINEEKSPDKKEALNSKEMKVFFSYLISYNVKSKENFHLAYNL